MVDRNIDRTEKQIENDIACRAKAFDELQRITNHFTDSSSVTDSREGRLPDLLSENHHSRVKLFLSLYKMLLRVPEM